MKLATHLRHSWHLTRSLARTLLVSLLCFYLLTGCDANLAARMQPQSPEPEAGLRDYQQPLFVGVPGGLVNAAGGNLFVRSPGLVLESSLGEEEVAPAYNSASNQWRFGFLDMTYDGVNFVDQTGASFEVTAVADGAVLPGSAWVKVDSDTIMAKGGLVFEFTGGVLVERHRVGQACPRILYEAASSAGPLEIRQQDCNVRGEWSALNTVLFTLTLDAGGRVAAVVDRAGRTATYTYDGEGRLVTARDGLDEERGWPGDRYEYGPVSRRLISATNSEGERIEYEYYSPTLLGTPRLQFATQLAQAGEGNLRFRFDYYPGSSADEFETVVTDPMGDRRRLFFDDSRRVQEIAFEAVAESELFGYDGPGLRPTSYTLANGASETYTRDADGDILTITQPSGNVVVHAYADANSAFPFNRALAGVQDSLGMLGSWTYTDDEPIDYKRLASATNGEAEQTRYGYHPNGGYTRLASVTFPDGVVREFSAYNALGQATQIIHGTIGGNVTFDEVGNLRAGNNGTSPEIGGVLARTYNADRVPVEISVADSNGQESAILLARGSDGRILSIDRPPSGLGVGPDHLFTYDTLGRAVERAERVDGVWRSTFFEYDDRGMRTAESLPNGMRRERAYDQRGRLASRHTYRYGVLEGSIDYTYVSGNLVLVEDSERGVEVRGYDAAGRLTSIQYAGGETIEYAYDLRSRIVSESYRLPDDTLVKEVQHEYDLANRETRVHDDGQLVLDRSFVDGRIDCVETGNGLNRCFSYEPVLGLRDGAVTTDASLAVVETTVLASGPTSAPVNWEITATTSIPGLGDAEATFTVGPGTDPAVTGSEVGKRIRSWDDGSGGLSQAFAFDASSNQVDDSDGDFYDYNQEGNRLLAATVGGVSVSYGYDDAGFADSRDGVPIEWTADGRMAAHGPFQIEWDLQGRPLRAVDTGTTPASIRDWSRWGGRIELDAGGFPVALDLGEVVLGFAGVLRYRHFDFRGNVSFVSDENGDVLTLYEYSPYGVSAVHGDAGDARRFVGRDELGPLMLMGARIYDPLIGRFLSPDPVFQLLNQYTYTLGNPVWFSDPTGREPTVRDGINVGVAALGVTIAILGFSVATTPLSVALAFAGLALSIYGLVVTISPAPSAPAGPTPPSTGCGCIPSVTMGDGATTSESPGGAVPIAGSDNGDDAGLKNAPAWSGSGVGGSSGFGGGGFSSVPSCGLTGIEFLWFVGFALRRRNKKWSTR